MCIRDSAELKGDAPPVDDETTARRFCERTAKAFDEDRTPELAIECVWENQSRDDQSLTNLASAARATLTRNAIERRPPGPWGRAEAPRAGIIRRLQPLRRRPFEGRLASLFAESGPPQVEGLPDLSWRWLSPWQVDGRVHGTDRGVSDIEEVGAPDAWLYAPKWPSDDMTGYSYDENEARVRCRRWVRPRERQTCGELVRLLLAKRPATRVAALLREAKSPDVDLAMLAASLVEVPVIKAPRPPPVEEKHARGVTVDYVWENQRWIRGWAPCVGLRKRGDVLEPLAVVDGYAERCCFEAGTVAMKRIAEACMARNRDPLCPWPYRPTLSRDRGRDRDYEFLAGGYAAFPGADAAQAASVRAALAVQNVPPGVVVSPYAVDDEKIRWEERPTYDTTIPGPRCPARRACPGRR